MTVPENHTIEEKRLSFIVRHSSLLCLLGAIVVAVGLKTWLVLADVVPFNSDEAIVALMARHILQGERPIFFYGQAYMGSLDAWLVAGGFALVGEHVDVIRLIQILLYVAMLWTTYLLGKVAFGSRRVGAVAVCLLAIPSVILTLYTTVSLGGYGEGLLLGNLILLQGFRLIHRLRGQKSNSVWGWSLWGIIAGLGLWTFGLTLVYSLPMGLVLLWQGWLRASKLESSSFFYVGKIVIIILVGGLIGSLPWWGYALQHGFAQLIRELSGGAIAGVGGGAWLLQIWNHAWMFILFGGTAVFGLRPSWEIRWLALPLLPLILAFWMGVIFHIIRRFKQKRFIKLEPGVLVAVMLTLGGGYIFTPFGADPSGRYFLPLMISLSLFAAEMVLSMVRRHGHWAWGLVALVLVYNLWGTMQSARRYPPGITTQFDPVAQVDHRYMPALIDFLHRQDETRGYTNYWVSYPLAFRSGETLIFIPALPYHPDFRYTPRDNRYAPYHKRVEQADRIAYITTNHPELNACLRDLFDRQHLDWRENQIGDYYVFYHLSQIIRPDELGLDSQFWQALCLQGE